MRSVASRTKVVVAVAVLMSGLAGCAQARPADPDPRPADPAPRSAVTPSAGTVLSDTALDLAVRAEPYRDDQRLLVRAERESTRRCMAARGFDHPAQVANPSGGDDPWRPDMDARRSRGYGFTDPGPSAEGQYPPDLPASRRAAYARALSGDPGQRATLQLSSGPRFTFATTGCIAEGRIALFGDVVDAARVAYVPQEAYNALHGRIAEDAAMDEAMKRWAACMKDRGHPYPSMSAARADAGRGPDAAGHASARQFEIQRAVADGGCALAAGVPEVVDRVGRRYAAGLAAEQRRDLNLAAELRATGLRRARDLVS
jgi:hypothetical protein